MVTYVFFILINLFSHLVCNIYFKKLCHKKTLVFLAFMHSILKLVFLPGMGEGDEGGNLEGEKDIEIDEDVEVIDDDSEGAVGGQEQEDSSSSDDNDEGDSSEKKQRNKESDIQHKVWKFWSKRGLVKYGHEWQTYSASYMTECVRQVEALMHKRYNVVCRDHFERITSNTYMLRNKDVEKFSKYLHLKSSDNDRARAIQRHLDCKDCGLIYVITFDIVFVLYTKYLYRNFTNICY